MSAGGEPLTAAMSESFLWNDGVDDLRVVELTGAAGDVILWHPGTLHAACPNVNDTPRLMLTATIQARTA